MNDTIDRPVTAAELTDALAKARELWDALRQAEDDVALLQRALDRDPDADSFRADLASAEARVPAIRREWFAADQMANGAARLWLIGQGIDPAEMRRVLR